MAINYSEKLVKKAFEDSYYVPNIKNKILKKLIKVINIFFLKKIRFAHFFLKQIIVNFIVNIKTPYSKNSFIYYIEINKKLDFKKINEHYIKHGWVFINKFLEEKCYKDLLENWPSDFYFKYRNNPLKNYLWGFEYLKRDNKIFYLDNDDKKLKHFKELQSYYNFILSDVMVKFVKETTLNQGIFECVSINCTSAKDKAFLIPHVDTIAIDNDFSETLNYIHFLDGNDSDIENSGGTGIYEDNEFKNPIFLPETLKNSLLLYNSKLNFFHGFKKVKNKNYRKAIAFQFFKSK